MSIKITAYGGAGMVGGNKILLEADDTAIFLDFGISYDLWSKYFEEYLKPRPTRGLVDLFEIGLLPPLKGIYRNDLEPSWEDVWKRFAPSQIKELSLDAVLLSHAHLDHSGHISFLDPNIPIFCSAATAFLAKAIQDSSRGDFEKEVCYAVPREEKGFLLTSRNKQPSIQRQFYFADQTLLSAEALRFWRTSPKSREMKFKHPRQATRIGNLEVRSFPVDHSIFGASAYAIRTSKGWIAYTGDIRLQGKSGGLSRGFAYKVKELKPLALICEGTNIDQESGPTEEDVLENALGKVREADGKLVIADFGPRNLERLLTFREIASQCGRRLVILSKDAYILQSLHLLMPEIPDPLADDVLVLYEEVKELEGWERELFSQYQERGKCVKPQDIMREEGGYIMCLSFWDINKLIDIRPGGGGMYIYSSSEAFDEEQVFDIKRLRKWIEHFGLLPVGVPDVETGKVAEVEKGFHSSGHAYGPGLEELVEIIDADVVIPVHTENPGLFLKRMEGRRILIPEPSIPLSIA